MTVHYNFYKVYISGFNWQYASIGIVHWRIYALTRPFDIYFWIKRFLSLRGIALKFTAKDLLYNELMVKDDSIFILRLKIFKHRYVVSCRYNELNGTIKRKGNSLQTHRTKDKHYQNSRLTRGPWNDTEDTPSKSIGFHSELYSVVSSPSRCSED